MLGLCIYLVWPANAFARALIRFVHAVPGVGTARVDVTTGSKTFPLGSIGFGQATALHSVRSGKFVWRLSDTAGKTLASGSASVGNGTFTAIVLAESKGATLGIYRDRAGEPGKSLIRVIHAAPEFGSPSLEFDSHVVAPRLAFTQATPYLSVKPGVHKVAAMHTGTSAPALSLSVHLNSDVAYTAIVMGSRGQPVRVVTVTDPGAPLTKPAASVRRGHRRAAHGKAGWATVHAGDCLWSIAREQLGPGASNAAVAHEVVRIWDANVKRIGTGDPNLIFPGQRLHIPAR